MMERERSLTSKLPDTPSPELPPKVNFARAFFFFCRARIRYCPLASNYMVFLPAGHYLFYRILHHVSEHRHSLGLPHSKSSRDGLFLDRWVPLRLNYVNVRRNSKGESVCFFSARNQCTGDMCLTQLLLSA